MAKLGDGGPVAKLSFLMLNELVAELVGVLFADRIGKA